MKHTLTELTIQTLSYLSSLASCHSKMNVLIAHSKFQWSLSLVSGRNICLFCVVLFVPFGELTSHIKETPNTCLFLKRLIGILREPWAVFYVIHLSMICWFLTSCNSLNAIFGHFFSLDNIQYSFSPYYWLFRVILAYANLSTTMTLFVHHFASSSHIPNCFYPGADQGNGLG